MRNPLLFGIAVLAVTFVFVFLIREPDVDSWSPQSAESADASALDPVEFNPLNANISVSGCGEVEFVDGHWLSSPDENDQHFDAKVGYFLVSDVVPESPGPEVVTSISCGGPGTAVSGGVYVFAGHTKAATLLGAPIGGSLERADKASGVLAAVRAWQDGDPLCCPTQYRVSEHRWDGGQWAESKVEYWTLDGQVLEHPLP